ncbi:hypothetical protein V5799_004192 [Amblyomma americanum]|uniref:CRAL-TRIO domain-containing protein n=1 Tax=Amblyomma americanum TaxID=6943 RepID=A0AAQ4D6T8_AMBAM
MRSSSRSDPTFCRAWPGDKRWAPILSFRTTRLPSAPPPPLLPDSRRLAAFLLPVLQKHFPGGFLDCSPEGHVCYLMPIGSVDIKGFLEVVSVEQVKRRFLLLFETLMDNLRRNSKQNNKVIETVFFIVDFEHFSLRQLYSWQAPRFFPILWKVLRPFLTQRTADKVAIYGMGELARSD